MTRTSLVERSTPERDVQRFPRRRIAFIGDSLTFTQAGRAAGFYDGRCWWVTTTISTAANLGSTWVVSAMVAGTVASATHVLTQNGAGSVAFTPNGGTIGDYVDCRQGGWFELTGGDGVKKCWINVRGATTPPAAPASSNITIAGIPTIQDWFLHSFPVWTAGRLGDTFSDYQCWGISGATTDDCLKFIPQALGADVEAVVLQIGTNGTTAGSTPATAATAAAMITDIQACINLCRARARNVYVGDIFPYPGATATQQKYLAIVSDAIREYCRGKSGVRFWSAWDRMVTNAFAATGKTGVYNTDNLHLMPYGGYLVAQSLCDSIEQDYPVERLRVTTLDLWDSTLLRGAWNTNPTLRGTGGTVTGSDGITGTAPDGWTISRVDGGAPAQTCTTSFIAAADGGADWWCMEVASAGSGDYHKLEQSVSVPTGVVAGDYFRIVAELCPMAMTDPGLVTMQMQAVGTSNLQAAYVVQTLSGRNLNTFTTELPVLRLTSEPQILLSGVTSFTMNIRIGASSVGGTATGKVGFRNFRLEKCDGPIYP